LVFVCEIIDYRVLVQIGELVLLHSNPRETLRWSHDQEIAIWSHIAKPKQMTHIAKPNASKIGST